MKFRDYLKENVSGKSIASMKEIPMKKTSDPEIIKVIQDEYFHINEFADDVKVTFGRKEPTVDTDNDFIKRQLFQVNSDLGSANGFVDVYKKKVIVSFLK